MNTTLVYPVSLADSGYHTVFNQSANFSDRNRPITIKNLSDQDLPAVFSRYLRIFHIFPGMSLYHFVTSQKGN